MHKKFNKRFAFVQFKNPDAAAAAQDITIKTARHQPTPLPTPPEPDSDSNILNALNDECLQEVFTYLTEFDLANCAQTCARFKQQAKITFKSKFQHLTVRSETQGVNGSTLLRIFGSSIRSLEIERGTLSRSLMQIIVRKCTQLKSLSLFKIDGFWTEL